MSASKQADNRPLSPHLQVYQPQLTSVVSITHRATGVALSVGTIGLVFWLVAAATGGAWWDCAQAAFSSWFGQFVLFGYSWALFFHLGNGIRHLFWDAGYGFELETAYKSGWIVVFASLVLTAAVWIGAYA